jgi:hypothetical protein
VGLLDVGATVTEAMIVVALVALLWGDSPGRT